MLPATTPSPPALGKEHLLHVGLFGRTNVGKSSLFNRLVGQAASIVSAHRGTTSDPVRRRVELPSVGPMVLVDTPGAADGSVLQAEREALIRQAAYQVDLALLLFARNLWGDAERRLLDLLRSANTPVLVVYACNDAHALSDATAHAVEEAVGVAPLAVSAEINDGIDLLISRIAKWQRMHGEPANLLEGILQAGQTVVLVAPIDVAAPKGRLILPQVQTLRAALDLHALPLLTQEEELAHAMRVLASPPDLVVTDSQIFASVEAKIPPSVPLTSFSILLARQKGDFARMLAGAEAMGRLRNGARILMVESCAHHATCEDIGRVKLPGWMRAQIAPSLTFDYAQGATLLPAQLGGYDLAILCGGCMVTLRQMRGTMQRLAEAGVPITNYGMAIAHLHGIFDRATAPFR